VTAATLVVRYAAFAAVATLANLAVQRAVFLLGNSAIILTAALAAGTIAGLVVKYLLDKRWIFHDARSGALHHARTFSLYTAMGLATTAIFWGFETAFWLIWRNDLMREAGALIGLAIGYFVKYRLDRRFVFQ